MNNTVEKKKGGKILDVIETVGNKLPHPYIMFLWLCLILAGISTVCSLAGVQVINPTTGETVLAKAIFSNCMAARKFTKKFSRLLSTWSGTCHADGNWIC